MMTHSTAKSPFLGFFSILNKSLKIFTLLPFYLSTFQSHLFSLYHLMERFTPSSNFTVG